MLIASMQKGEGHKAKATVGTEKGVKFLDQLVPSDVSKERKSQKTS
jgi:hypothetical protein